MHWLATLLVASVTLGGGFGDASATAQAADDGTMVVDLEVEVGDAATVVAHLLDVGADQQTVTLGSTDGTTYMGRVVVVRANLIVVFEALYVDGTSRTSRPVNLSELGADQELVGPGIAPVPDEPTGLSAATTRWIWIAIALTALSLALMALWAAGPRPAPRRGASNRPQPDRPSVRADEDSR
ncbi:MAG: hypothetical protein OEO77_05325 [Acidimicrobiia bacterium]|nr:hypothetical protein [Acidimicrobiia bacterium]